MSPDFRKLAASLVTQMVRLVDDLLDVSRITRNKLELKKQWVTLDLIGHEPGNDARAHGQQHTHSS